MNKEETNRTVREILSDLPEPFSTQAIENTVAYRKPEYLDELRNYSTKEAVSRLFGWGGTPQGESYWKEFHATL